jgi:hypothetical protein
MKRLALSILAFLMVVSLLPAVWAAQENNCPVPLGSFSFGQPSWGSVRHTVTVDPEKLVVFRNRLILDGFDVTCEPGKPQLPFAPVRLPIPAGFRAMQVKLVSSSFVKKPIPELEPYTPKVWMENLVDKSEKKVETKTGFYPQGLGNFKFEKGMSGNYASVAAYPIVLDYDAKIMHVATQLTFAVELVADPSTKNIIEDEEKQKSLILTSSKLKVQADKLAKSQKDSGYEVEVVEVEQLASQFKPQEEEPDDRGPKNFSKNDKTFMANYDYDFAKKIRAYLATRIGQVSFVTLLGDGTHIPPSFYYLNYSYMKIDKYVPSDIYYSSPDLDYVPDFALGRLPVRNANEAEAVVSKIIEYRKVLKADWFHSINLLGGDPFSGGFEGELECQSIIDDGLIDNFNINKYYKTEGKFDGESVKKAFSQESGFIYAVSHGSGDAIVSEPGKFTTDDVLALPKRSKLPILMSGACINGMYDAGIVNYKLDQYPNSKGLSFAQACMISPGGPIAYFGGTRLNYAGINWTVESGIVKAQPFSEIDRAMKEILNAYHNWAGTLGELSVNAFTKYTGIEKGWFSSNKTTYCFAFFGDPTIKLPTTPEGTPHRQPEVEFKGCPITKGRIGIPILSYVDTNTINVKTDLKNLKLRVFDLEDDAKVVEKGEFKQTSEKQFSITHKPQTKNLWHARIDLPNKSEVWFYYLASANTDISIINRTTFYTRKPGERLRFNLDISNDGIKKLNNVEVSFILDDKKIETRKIKVLDTFEYRPMNFILDGMEKSKHKVRFEVKMDEKEQYPEDNILERDLVITDEDTAKTGIMISYLFNASKADKVFNIKKYNEMAKTLGTAPAELAKIGSDSYWEMLFGARYENFKNLGVDTLFVATQGFGNPYETSLVKALSDFLASGGTVVGLGCLGPSSNGPAFATLAELFGFSNQIDYESNDVPNMQLVIGDRNHPLFSSLGVDKISMRALVQNNPPAKSWTEAIAGAQILAKSEDGYQIAASNSKNLFLSVMPRFETDLDMKLLYNLSTYNLRPQPDASLTLSGMTSDPSRISVGKPAKLVLTVKNVGNTDLSNLEVKVDQLGTSGIIEKIARNSEANIEFPIPVQEKIGIVECTASVKCVGDVNLSDNQATLRIRVFETVIDQKENSITDLNIKDGDVLTDKPFMLSGKTQPNSLVMANGRVTRSDLQGRFALYMTPGQTPLAITVKKTDGTLSKVDIWCSFAPLASVGGTIDKKPMFADGTYMEKNGFVPVKTISQNNFVNMTDTFSHLGLEFTNEKGEFVFSSNQYKVSGKVGSDTITYSIGNFKKDVSLGKAIVEADNALYIPFTSLMQLGFGGDIHSESKTYILTFPKDQKLEPFSPYETSNTNENSDTSGFPSEGDYGKPAILSWGPVDGEVFSLADYWIGENITIWTSRGFEVWTKEGKFVRCLGFPQTASKDLNVSWNFMFHPPTDDYLRGNQSFIHLPDGSLILMVYDSVAFYDKDWKLVKLEKFNDGGLSYSIPLMQDKDGNIKFLDSDNICYTYSTKGEKLGTMTFKDSDNSMLSSVSTMQILSDGKILIYDRSSYWFLSLDWSVRLYDSNGLLLKEKVVKMDLDLEKFMMAPTYIIGDLDGTYWSVTDNFNEILVHHMDADFNITDKVSLGSESMYARGGFSDIRIDSNGQFWSKGKFYLKDDKQATLLANYGKDFKFISTIKQASIDREQLYPYDMVFDREGNLVLYFRNDMKRFSQLGNSIENLKFNVDDEDTISYINLLKHEGEYSTGVIEGRDSYIILIADKEYNVKRSIPALVEEPIYIVDYETDLENNEIFVVDEISSIPIKVIPAYMDKEKDPTEVEIIRQFGSRGIGQGKISQPGQIHRFGDRIYILDQMQSKVLCYDKTGNFLFEFGGQGTNQGKLANPDNMMMDSKGFIWILDWRNSRIAVYDSEGTFITNLGKEAMYTTPSTVDGYSQNPFDLLHPYCMAVRDGQIAIFEYTHDRIFILSASESTTNMTVYPEKPALNGYATDNILKTWFTVSNTGSGNLEAKISCDNKNVKITGDQVKNNAGLVKIEFDRSKDPDAQYIKLKVESSIGNGEITLPINLKPIDFAFAPGSMIAIGAQKMIRLSRTPVKTDSGFIFSTKDFPDLIPLNGLTSKDGNTVFYSIGDRRLGFEAGKSWGWLQIGEDTFKVDLGAKVEKTKDNGLTVPIDVVASFMSCQIIKQEGYYEVVTRK